MLALSLLAILSNANANANAQDAAPDNAKKLSTVIVTGTRADNRT